ncbi:unannotated protein [freshwater metagenome]|uniref:Unannotated protein n=1 Tax=freshwater metagenome TaxID=449393 RepID=A0A6J6YFB9_9ZZZZ
MLATSGSLRRRARSVVDSVAAKPSIAWLHTSVTSVPTRNSSATVWLRPRSVLNRTMYCAVSAVNAEFEVPNDVDGPGWATATAGTLAALLVGPTATTSSAAKLSTPAAIRTFFVCIS